MVNASPIIEWLLMNLKQDLMDPYLTDYERKDLKIVMQELLKVAANEKSIRE